MEKSSVDIKDSRSNFMQMNSMQLSEEDVKECLNEFAQSQCCYQKNNLERIKIIDIQMINSFHYKLQTFTERMEVNWIFEPYRGPSQTLASKEVASDQELAPENFEDKNEVDNAHDQTSNGNEETVPEPWSIAVDPPKYFEEGSSLITVPNSSSISKCHVCLASCKLTCSTCRGKGGSGCIWCSESGYGSHPYRSPPYGSQGNLTLAPPVSRLRIDSNHRSASTRSVASSGGDIASDSFSGSGRCLHCNGTGRARCYPCKGNGVIRCHTCEGFGRLISYLQLKVTWNNHISESICDNFDTNHDINYSMLRSVSGMNFIEEENESLSPYHACFRC